MPPVKRNTDNFLHANPELYLAFNGGDNEQNMARFLHRLFAEYGIGRHVLDVGCGPGREVAYLRNAGYRPVGMDHSPEMLAWAKEKHPDAVFLLGDQSNFSLNETFDAIYCVGSTFLYNLTNEMIQSCLSCFRTHLRPGGLLYLDMRNAAFFLTAEGRSWLDAEHVETRIIDGMSVTMTARFSLDLPRQLLIRDYDWTIEGQEPIRERLLHRLLFPQEILYYLKQNGFRVLEVFDKPEPHLGSFDASGPLIVSRDLFGRRMQVIAKAI